MINSLPTHRDRAITHAIRTELAFVVLLTTGSATAVAQAAPSAGPAAAPGPAAAETVTLHRAIELALTNNRMLETAEEQLAAANQQVRNAWSQALPEVSATASYSRNLKVQQIFLPAEFFGGNPGETRPVRVGNDNSWSAGLNVSQPLFRFDVFVGVGAAGRYRSLQEEMVRGTAQQVVSAVRQAYFGALLAQEELRLTQESIARVRKTLDEARARNRVGLASEYDVLRLEVEYANVAANLKRSENAVAQTHRQLNIEMGRDPDLAVALTGRLDRINLEDPSANAAEDAELVALSGAVQADGRTYDDLLATALRQRTDLRQLRGAVDLEEARVGVAKAQFFPKLSLFSNYNVSAQENGRPNFFGEGPNTRTTSAAAGLQVEIPIFNGFGRFAGVAERQAVRRQTEAQLARAEQEAVSEVRTLTDAVEEARLRAGGQHRAVEQADRGYEIASAEYREGIGSQLQLTDAEVALRESEFNYARAVYDYLVARTQLDLALGLTPDLANELPAGPAR
jgi:outer membrane protein TolC